MNPTISIIIPLYNKEKHIRQTLNTVWAQTFRDFEVIIVDDGSTDDSLAQVQAIEDSRIHIYSTENKGVSHARNFGISKAKTELIAFLDADDFWRTHHLEDLVALYQEFPNCGMYCKAYEKHGNNLKIPSNYNTIPEKEIWSGIITDYFEASLTNSIAWTSAVMVPKTTFKSLGNFNETYNSGEDTDLWIRIALKFPVAFDNRVSAIHNLSSEQKITNQSLHSRQHIDFSNYEKVAKNNKSLKQYLDLNWYALAMQYKLESQNKKAIEAFQHIDLHHLSGLQKTLFKLPKSVLKGLLSIRGLLRKSGFNVKLFR